MKTFIDKIVRRHKLTSFLLHIRLRKKDKVSLEKDIDHKLRQIVVRERKNWDNWQSLCLIFSYLLGVTDKDLTNTQIYY